MAFVVTVVSASFEVPADTSPAAYASGDLIANSHTAASVTPMSFTAARTAAGSFMVRRARLKKSTASTTAASFRLHLYGSSPANITNGDNGAWLTDMAGYLGSIDLDMSGSSGRVFNDGAAVVAGVAQGIEIAAQLASGQTAYALLEARGAYTAGTAEAFTAELELVQN